MLFLLFMGVIGAAIGWITNILAIKLLFRPAEPISLPFVGWTLQGLIPKRHNEIALALANVVSLELITGNDVAHSLGKEEIKEKLVIKIQLLVRERVMDKLPAIVPRVVQVKIADYVCGALGQEIRSFLNNPQQIIREDELEAIREEIKSIVEEKVKSFNLQRLEELIYLVAQKELKHIELLGGILGFLIGLIQGLITLLFI